MINIQTLTVDDFIFTDGAGKYSHNNLVDIRSENPGQTTYAYLKQLIPAQKTENTIIKSIQFSYRYMTGYKGRNQAPVLQLIAFSEDTKQSRVYTSDQLALPNYEDNDTMLSDRVKVVLENISLHFSIKTYQIIF